MKKLILSIPFLILWFVGFSAVSQAQDFFLAANGVTVMCPDANVGETGEVNSITYTKRTKEEIDTDNAETTCTSGITNMAEMFFDATFFNGDISAWDVSGVTDMSSMFYYAGSFNGDISTWDVSGVTNMGGMFTRATFFNGDISAWDVSGVTDMGGMFFNATHFNGDISAWDVSGVTDMLYMFSSAGSFNGNISTWDVSSVMYMGGMFNNASSFNQDISGWDVSGVTDMSGMFYSAGSFNGNISTWDVSGVTDMTNMFTNAGSFNGNISTWDVSGVTNMSEMFFAAGSFNGDISTWNVSGVTNMYRMFYSAGSFNGDISAWEVSGVTSMTQMFYNAGSFNRDLSGWCVEQFATMPNNFDIGAATWVLPRPVWGTCPVGMPELQSLADDATDVELSPTFSWSAARYAETYTIQLSTSDNFDTDVSEVSEITETENTLDSTLVHGQKYYWRVRGAKNFETGDWSASRTFTTLNNFERLASNGRTIVCHDVEVGESGVIDGITYTKRTKAQINTENAETTCTSGITDMYQMFSNAGSFNGNISTWDVSSVWNMSWMFSNAGSFNGDLSTWNVSGVTNMSRMFSNAGSFNGDLSTWNVSGVTNMSQMFFNAGSFNGDISTWDVSGVTDMSTMFYDAGSFNGDISAWDVSSVMYMGSMFSYADSFNGDISAWEVSGVRNMSFMFSDAGSFNGNISTWDVSGVTDMYGMFTRTSTFNEDISGWDVSSVTDMSYMFSGAGSFNGDISTWEVSGVTDMSGMFYSAGSFNGNISTWDVSGVTNMSRMFFNAGSFNGGISTWEVSGVTNMAQMFRDASAFNQDLSGWCVEQIASEPNDFDYGANAWVLPKPNWGTCPAKELTIFGNAGWRMLSFPVGGVSVSSLAGQNLVQGVAGADAFYDDGSTYEEAAANLYYYLNTTADNWQEFDTFDAEISSGQGFIWYMFDNNNVNSVALPFTLSASGESPSADVTIPINPSDDFTLIGNPFKGNLNASDVSGWGDLQATARTWYPDAGAEGEYVNTTASTPSFTGFFVEKSESGSGDITIPVAAVSSKKADVESFRMALSLQGINENDIAISDHSTSVLFREGAAHKWDVYDATKLVPLLSSYATIGIVGDRGGEERVKAIASHPTDFEDALELPLAFNVSNFEGEFELSAEMESLPESWSVLLQDTETGETIDLRRASHSFNYQAESKAQKVSEIKYRMPDSYVMSAGEAIHRFTLTIEAGESVSTTGPGTELPQHVALNQNYPNPFNPSTAISYELPEASDVTLQVYDMTGRQIATLINREAKSAGRHTVQFDAGRLSSGVYIYRMKAGNTVITKKLTLIK